MSAIDQISEPTFLELGFANMYGPAYALTVRKGTPQAVIDKLSTEIGRAVSAPDLRERLVEQGMEPFVSTPDQFSALLRADVAKYSRAIRVSNIRFDR